MSVRQSCSLQAPCGTRWLSSSGRSSGPAAQCATISEANHIQRDDTSTSIQNQNKQTNDQRAQCSVIDSLDASKPPEGAGVPLAGSGAAAAAATEAGRGAVGDGRVPIVSKPVSRRSLCTGAGVRDAAAVGARVGDISPEWVGGGHSVTRCHCGLFKGHFSTCVCM